MNCYFYPLLKTSILIYQPYRVYIYLFHTYLSPLDGLKWFYGGQISVKRGIILCK